MSSVFPSRAAQCVGYHRSVRRIDIPEIHEQPWLPDFLRDEVTDALQAIFGMLRAYQPAAPKLAAAAAASRVERFVDLCAGAGGPWPWLQPEIASSRNGGALPVVLTDKFPNLTSFERLKSLSRGAIDYAPAPIDASGLPANLSGFRTIFSSFHHFTPPQAAAILQNAADHRQGIGIFELARRRPKTILFTFLVPLAALIAAPFTRPFRLSRLAFTYLLPLIPLILWIDGVLSSLRAYTPAELREMSARLKAPGYTWEVGETTTGLIPVTYLLGYPAANPTESR